MDLARKHDVEDTGALLSKYAAHLVGGRRTTQAVELYRKAGRRLEAANLLFKVRKHECMG